MRIIELSAENFKRLHAVTIAPSGNIVEVTGDNGAGKSSTLDAIWAALGGKDACPEKPIRSGAEKAEVRLILGDGNEPRFKVTRRFKLKEGVSYTTDLMVENAEGARFDKAQGMLDAMVGALCFDPLAFTSMKPAEQMAALRQFVPEVDFAGLEGLNKRDFDTRTEVNRRAKELRAQAEALPVAAGDVPERVDVGALQKTLTEASAHNSTVEQRRVRREGAQARLQAIAEEIAKLHAEQAALEEQLKTAGPLPDLIDVQEVSAKLTEAHAANELVDRIERRQAIEARAKEAEEEAMSLTVAIDKRKDEMRAAVARAKMPVRGLGFGEDCVTFNGEPFAQASRAEQIRASVAIAAAMNPRLKVARIVDGSLLDKKSWAALEAYAGEHDLQVWIETVSQHGQAAVLIEDGSVVPVDKPTPGVVDVGDVV